MISLRTFRIGVFALLGALAIVAPPRAHAEDPITGLPVSALIYPAAPCADDDVSLSYSTCGPCGAIEFASADSVVASARPGIGCPPPLCPSDARSVSLGRFAAGTHRLTFRVIHKTYMPDSSVVTRRETRVLEFDVRRECGGTGDLRFVDRVVIGSRPAPCDTCPSVVCAGDSVRVELGGRLPTNCWSVRSVEWLPLMTPVDRPVLMVTIADSTCSAIPECWFPGQSWSAVRALPPASPGVHPLVVGVRVVSCDSSRVAATPVEPVYRTFAYVVVDSCGPPSPGCVESTIGRFGDRTDSLRCDVLRDAEGGAVADLEIRTFRALAGLEGIVRMPPGSQVLSLEPIGPAAGMSLVTRPPAGGEPGLDFVLFGLRDQVIPPGTWPVLRARVRVPLESMLTTLVGAVTLAADSLAREVPICVHIRPEGRAVGICAPRADSCDANGDGATNVRDLVVMARCLREPRNCPAPGPAAWDCTHDGVFGVPDLVCCAWRILRGGGLDTASVRPIEGVALEMGRPVRGESDVLVPLRLLGANHLGGAVLRLEYPLDRYELAGVDFVETPDWLQLSDATSAGGAEIGLIALGTPSAGDLPLNVRLRLRSGATHGGMLRVRECDLSNTEGARVSAPLEGAQIVLGADGATGSVTLSTARPNPSAGLARFAVSLSRASDVDLGVFDLAGRRVATLASGPLPAGAREYTWDARAEHYGVYFARLVVDGRIYASRVTLLRRR